MHWSLFASWLLEAGVTDHQLFIFYCLTRCKWFGSFWVTCTAIMNSWCYTTCPCGVKTPGLKPGTARFLWPGQCVGHAKGVYISCLNNDMVTRGESEQIFDRGRAAVCQDAIKPAGCIAPSAKCLSLFPVTAGPQLSHYLFKYDRNV